MEVTGEDRSPEMESTARRRSRRVVVAPDRFQPAALSVTVKRKRGTSVDYRDDQSDIPSDSEDDESDSASMSHDDHPAVRPVPRRTKNVPAKQPSVKRVKKTKTAAAAVVPKSLPSRPKKPVQVDAEPEAKGILYNDIFLSTASAKPTVERWFARYQEDAIGAVAELVNLVLQCSGCDLQITADDISDPDHCADRLAELQDLFQEQGITDYPLMSKGKNGKTFQPRLVGFFSTLVSFLHEADVLYKQTSLIENTHVWMASMSSSKFRPFRHTATVVALAIMTALVDVAVILDTRIANLEEQFQASSKGKNKAKSAQVKRTLDEANANRQICENHIIQDFFSTVFIHRYRDVEPKIRTDCVELLGYWIWRLPGTFLHPEYLRYLGWMLSDAVPATRQEVLRQLARILKRDSHKLGHFIDRFRSRLIELAAQDVDVSVRVAAISVIEILRAAGMLEPSEIDPIGRLIFDRDPKIRKGVVGFFHACIKDVIDAKIEELGGNELLDEVLDNSEVDDCESPRREWVVIKCLAQTLAVYDEQIEEEQRHVGPRRMDAAAEVMQVILPETRMSLAAQALYDRIPEAKRWDLVAGYLLFDHTTSSKSKKPISEDINTRQALAPTRSEEVVLLEVLASAIKLTSVTEKLKRKAGDRQIPVESQDNTALKLALLIPRLLNKFGADPDTATGVLRMEHFLDLDVFQMLRQDSAQYGNLLDEISTLFTRHDDNRVLSEAAKSLLHGRKCEELEEITDTKLAILWDNTINCLHNFDHTCELSLRGNLGHPQLAELCTILLKISKLASISYCIDVFEAEGRSAESSSSAIAILVNIVHRGKLDESDPDMDSLEDQVTYYAITACQFYFMWKIRAISQSASTGLPTPTTELATLASLRRSYYGNLIQTFSSRQINDDIRLCAVGSACDLQVLFGSLQGLAPETGAPVLKNQLEGLFEEIDPRIVPELCSIYDQAERTLAKKAKKTLNDPADDDEPLDDDLSGADDDEDGMTDEERQAAELKAERALCELASKFVLAIVAKVLDQSAGARKGKLRKRMLRNQHKLGPNVREALSHLNEIPPQARSAAARPNKEANLKPKRLSRAFTAVNLNIRANSTASDAVVISNDEESDGSVHEDGSREDLRRRELLDDDGDDEMNQSEQEVVNGKEAASEIAADDDVLGD